MTPGIPDNFLRLLNPNGTILVPWDGAVACEKDDRKMLVLILKPSTSQKGTSDKNGALHAKNRSLYDKSSESEW